MKTFRIFNIFTNETILYIHSNELNAVKGLTDEMKISYWLFKNYGDIDYLDFEEI